MKSLARCPLASLAALATYLVVHVIVPATHHHQGTESRCDGSSRTTANCYLVSGVPADDAHEDEDHCLLCGVLHMAQITLTIFHADAITASSHEVVSAVAIVRPFPISTSTHSRAPPD
jgi:hypothetical protein